MTAVQVYVAHFFFDSTHVGTVKEIWFSKLSSKSHSHLCLPTYLDPKHW